MSKDLGKSTSYAYYVDAGGTKTPQEYGEMLVNIDTVATRAEDAADAAAESATGALNSKNAAQTAATTATTKASEATTAAQTATTKAGEASTSASTATSAKDTAVSASQTATSKATEATTAAATATSAATTATTAKDDAVSAKTAAQTAQTGAEAAAASVAGSAAQIQENTDDIDQLKSDLNAYGAVITNDEIIKNGVGSNVSIPDDATVPYMVINSIDSDVTQLISRNKQLISFDGVSINGSNLTSVFTNNKIKINGTFSGQNKHFGALSVPFTFKAGHTYTLSAELVSGTATKEINFNLGDSSGTTLLDVAVTTTKKQKTKTFVTDATATKIGWGEYYPNATFTDAVYAVQIEESSSATQYVDAEQYVYDDPQSGNIIAIVIGGSIDLIGEQENLAYSFAFYKKSVLNKRVITVKTDGSGDYTSLVDALKSVESDNWYVVQVFEGTYVLSDEWTAEELANANYPSGFCGTVVPSNCDLIGVGDKEKIIITAEANTDYTWNDTWRHISTLNVEGGSTIKNLTIRNKGMRYTIHHDFPPAKGKITNYVDCFIDKWGTPDGHAIGAGAHNGEVVNIKNCVIKPAIGWHGHNPATIGATLNIEDTIIENCIELTDYLTGYAMPVNLTNVRCNAIVYNKYVANAAQYMRINMRGGNTLVISSEDAIYDMEGVEYKLSNTTIAKGKPVKKSTYFGRVEAMTQSDNQNLFYGVTMEELPYFQYDVTDYVFGRVITKGYVSTTLLGITGFSVGDEIGVTNGSFSIVSENGIGVIDYVIDNIGYMRIK